MLSLAVLTLTLAVAIVAAMGTDVAKPAGQSENIPLEQASCHRWVDLCLVRHN